jgi:nicotinamidase-related amidase
MSTNRSSTSLEPSDFLSRARLSGLPGARTDVAVVLVDMQNDVIKMKHGRRYVLPPERQTMVANCAQLASAAREAAVPVFYIKVERRADGTDWPRSIPYDPTRLVEGTAGSAIIDEVAPISGDYVITKRRISGFSQTPLDFFLRAVARRTLLIGGFATIWGVESTVRDAWDLDYQVVVVDDACASPDLEDHRFAVERVFAPRGGVIAAATASEWLLRSAT